MKSLFFFPCLLFTALAAPLDLSTSSYPFSAVLTNASGEIYTLHWGFDTAKETIRLAVNVSTTGWVGFGLSPTGDMPNSDVVIGWVNDDGKAFFNDRFAYTTALPLVDPEQNWFLENGVEKNGFTILAFRRNWVTTDKQFDRVIKTGVTQVVFSWNENDPAKDNPNAATYHGPFNRGTQNITLLSDKKEALPGPVDLSFFDDVDML